MIGGDECQSCRPLPMSARHVGPSAKYQASRPIVGTSALLRLAFDSSARLKTGFIFGSGGVFLTRRISLNIHPSILKLPDCTPLYPFDGCAKFYSSPPHSFIAIADRIRVRIPGCHISARVVKKHVRLYSLIIP